MLSALMGGTTDPNLLAELARGRLRSKLPALRQAPIGRFRTHHAFLVGRLLAHIDYLEESIIEISGRIAESLSPFATMLERLVSIPGVGRRTAEVLIAETGADMSRFPTAAHLSSWAGMCPGNDESAGKRRRGKTRRGNPWLLEAGNAASHTKTRACRPLPAPDAPPRSQESYSRSGPLDSRDLLPHL